MKFFIMGIGSIICGVVMIAADFISRNILTALPNVHSVDKTTISITVLGWIAVAIGFVIAVFGYREDEESNNTHNHRK